MTNLRQWMESGSSVLLIACFPLRQKYAGLKISITPAFVRNSQALRGLPFASDTAMKPKKKEYPQDCGISFTITAVLTGKEKVCNILLKKTVLTKARVVIGYGGSERVFFAAVFVKR